MILLGSWVAFLILICILVSVHEFGHFIAARANGVFVEAFSIGFGPVLYEFKDKRGTKWRLSLLPFGGYVKMFGDADVTSVREVAPPGYTDDDLERMSAHRKKPWQRLIIAASGPFANFVFAICVLISLATIKGVPEYTVKPVSEDSVAYVSGLRDGDKILSANDKEVKTFEEFRSCVVSSSGKELALDVKRGDKELKINIKMYKKENDKIIPIEVIGVGLGEPVYKEVQFVDSVVSAVRTTYVMAYENINGIFKMLSGKISLKSMGGPVSIFKASANSAEGGLVSYILMMAMLSTMLGAVNLLPIPVLDGGTVFISAVEWIIGRPLNKRFVEVIFVAGLLVVASLMLLGIWNDLSSCKFFVWVENLFK